MYSHCRENVRRLISTRIFFVCSRSVAQCFAFFFDFALDLCAFTGPCWYTRFRSATCGACVISFAIIPLSGELHVGHLTLTLGETSEVKCLLKTSGAAPCEEIM